MRKKEGGSSGRMREGEQWRVSEGGASWQVHECV